MKTIFCILVLYSLSALPVLAQQKNDSVFAATTLQSVHVFDVHQNKTIQLKTVISSYPLYLFIFLSPECPLCQNYTTLLNKLLATYQMQVRMVGVFPGKSYTAGVIRTFVKEYKIGFPVLIDPAKKLTRYLQGTVTPEVILLNANYELVYRGAIDNLLKDLGEKKVKATQHYLDDAIKQALLHNTVTVKRTTAVGCLINDF